MDGHIPPPPEERQTTLAKATPAVGARLQLQVDGRPGGGFASVLVGWVVDEFVIVRRPQSQGVSVSFEPGENLRVRLFTGTELMEFVASVHRTYGPPLNYLHLEYPKTVRAQRFRHQARVEVRLAAQAEVGDSRFDVHVLDLNTLGARVQCAHPLGERGSMFKLHLPVEGSPPLLLRAEVRSVKELSAEPRSLMHGLQFSRLTDDDKAALQRLLVRD